MPGHLPVDSLTRVWQKVRKMLGRENPFALARAASSKWRRAQEQILIRQEQDKVIR